MHINFLVPVVDTEMPQQNPDELVVVNASSSAEQSAQHSERQQDERLSFRVIDLQETASSGRPAHIGRQGRTGKIIQRVEDGAVVDEFEIPENVVGRLLAEFVTHPDGLTLADLQIMGFGNIQSNLAAVRTILKPRGYIITKGQPWRIALQQAKTQSPASEKEKPSKVPLGRGGRLAPSAELVTTALSITEVNLMYLMLLPAAQINWGAVKKQVYDYVYEHEEEFPEDEGDILTWQDALIQIVTRVYTVAQDPNCQFPAAVSVPAFRRTWAQALKQVVDLGAKEFFDSPRVYERLLEKMTAQINAIRGTSNEEE